MTTSNNKPPKPLLEYDRDFVRPRFHLVFSMLSVLTIICLNIWFWTPYLPVIFWAVAAAQWVRPKAVKLGAYCAEVRKKRKEDDSSSRWTFVILIKEFFDLGGNIKSNAAVLVKPKSMIGFLGKKVFLYPAVSLPVVITIHLMPGYAFVFMLVLTLVISVLVTMMMDVIGVMDKALALASKPQYASTVIISFATLIVVFVNVLLFAMSVFELADVAYQTTHLVKLQLNEMSTSKELSPLLTWARESMEKGYAQLEHTYGTRRWFGALTAVRQSFSRRESAEQMASSMLDALRSSYNDTNWLWAVETAVLAAVPRHRGMGPESAQVVGKDVLSSVEQEAYKLVGQFSPFTLYSNAGLVVSSIGWFARDAIQWSLDSIAQLFVFLFLLQKLCGSQRDVLTTICLVVVPTGQRGKRKLNDDLQNALINAVTVPASAAVTSTLCVLIVFGILRQPWPFTAAVVVFVINLVHVFPETWSLIAASLPWILIPFGRWYVMYKTTPQTLDHDWWINFVQSFDWFDLLRASVLPLALIRLNTFARRVQLANEDEHHIRISPWLTDFSIGMGVSRFGADGLLFGPFLAGVSVVTLEFVMALHEQDSNYDEEVASKYHTSNRGSNLGASSSSLINLSAYGTDAFYSTAPTLQEEDGDEDEDDQGNIKSKASGAGALSEGSLDRGFGRPRSNPGNDEDVVRSVLKTESSAVAADSTPNKRTSFENAGSRLHVNGSSVQTPSASVPVLSSPSETSSGPGGVGNERKRRTVQL